MLTRLFRQSEECLAQTMTGKNGFRGLLVSISLVMLMASLPACGNISPVATSSTTSTGKTKLIVFEADSLMVPLAEVEKEFEADNPDIDVQMEAHGSIQVIRQVTELGQDCDVVAVADSSLIPMLMYQTMMPSGGPYANWYIEPATNQMVIAYNSKSKYADEINVNNWYEVLSRPDVRIGLADPRMDAVGYRTLMMTKLAESFYGVPDIMKNMIGNCFSFPITSFTQNGISTITVPELLDPADKRMYLRGANMELLSLLEANEIDYTFDYTSVVVQHNLKYLTLPSQINLGDETLADNYGKVVVKLDFQRFKTIAPIFKGVPIAYGVTIPNNASHKEAAVKYLQFVLGPDGQRIFNNCNQPELIPPECDNIGALPDALKPLFK
jgi:molybdate/tungstate transport system substrate-binding protein